LLQHCLQIGFLSPRKMMYSSISLFSHLPFQGFLHRSIIVSLLCWRQSNASFPGLLRLTEKQHWRRRERQVKVKVLKLWATNDIRGKTCK
jgi:hypothetical protein